MRAVDTTIYYGPWPFRKAGTEDLSFLKKHCGKNCIDAMLVSSVQGIFYEDPFEADILLHEAISNEPGMYHIMTVNPHVPNWKQDVKTAVRDFDIKGIKIYPGYHEYSLQDHMVDEICKEAGKYDLPLVIAGRVEDLRVCHMLHPAPIPLDRLGVFLGRHRDNTIVLSNFSFGDVMALKGNILVRDKVYVDMSGFIFISYPLEKLLTVYPKEMFLFGSQFPLYNQRGVLNEITEAAVSEEVKQAVLRNNAVQVFRL